MPRDFQQIDWDADLEDDCRQLVRLAVREDLAKSFDLTTVALVPPDVVAKARIVAREAGVVAGLPAIECALDEMHARIDLQMLQQDGAAIEDGTCVAEITGDARDMLTCERIVLNLLSRLSGIATLTRQYVQAIAQTRARVYDTRKTTPGWRRLEKYAVRRGGGCNHRTGLFDAVLIKDNHLALLASGAAVATPAAADAVSRSRRLLQQMVAAGELDDFPIIQIEVDTLDQLREVLPAGPDIVLLDNMTTAELRQAIEIRAAAGVVTELEASGGVNLATIREIAATGVDRISVGALTHSAVAFDFGLDWST